MKPLPLLLGGAFLAAFLLHHTQTSNERSSVRNAIENQEAAFFLAMKGKDANALADLYDQNAILIPPAHGPIRGKDAIRRFYQQFNAAPERLEEEQFTPLALDVCGDFAMDVSAFSGRTHAPGKSAEAFHGKDLVIWKRQPDGSWKYYRDMWDATLSIGALVPPRPKTAAKDSPCGARYLIIGRCNTAVYSACVCHQARLRPFT